MINKFFKNIICPLVISFFFVVPAYGVSQREIECINAIRAVRNQTTPTQLSLDICKNRCEVLPYQLRKNNNLEAPYQMCVSQSGSPDSLSSCSDSVQALVACKGGCKANYDSCLTTCRGLPTAEERTEAFKKCDANYKGKPTEAVAPVDDGAPSSDPATEDPEAKTPEEINAVDPTANTGDPNVTNQASLLDGLAQTPTLDPSIGGTDASAIDFSSGPSADANGYGAAGGGVSSTGGFVGAVGQDRINDNRFIEDPVGTASNNNSEAKSGGGGANGGGGGANGGGGGGVPPASAGGGSGNASNNNAGGKRASGGGSYRNTAGEYLARHNPFGYQSGGTSNLPGAKTSARTIANKKNPDPKYVKKENDSKDALNRLFGNGVAPASYRRNPYGAGSGHSCMDTVFCTMEIFYNKIERYPNHEINPDSY